MAFVMVSIITLHPCLRLAILRGRNKIKFIEESSTADLYDAGGLMVR